MRNYIKKGLLDLVQTLRELCYEMLQECERKNKEYVYELLEQGQQAAISMGETIERFEGQGTEAVSALEVFCDHMYYINNIQVADELVVTKERKILDKLLLNIENGIRHLPIIYEIVFLPYKASMWDCMESIYFAAVNDSDCIASVVPVPYYDIVNNSFGQMHYEGELFPKEIPIISWKEYNLSERRPDIIYIHNPFDKYNLVTSVHPDYYSDKLKKYVDKLVYVPYAIHREGVPNSHLRLPVHENMDYMIVQSRILEKFYKDKVFKGKLLTLGSPKFDRVVTYQKSNLEIPEEWKKNLDGKVKIFYNTSLSALLADTEAVIKKIEYVLDCFKVREDAALIWRPHPLLDSTLQSMRPQYLDRYRKSVQRFKQENIGVFDQTDNMEKTMAISDVYIGESSSSALDIFCALGKPVFLLNMKMDRVLSEKELCDSLFCNVELYQGKAWTFSLQLNALCILDIETGKLRVVASIPGYNIQNNRLVSHIYGYHNKLILSPNQLDSIVEFDLETEKFHFIKLPNALNGENMGSIVSYGEDFFILPYKYSAIIQYSSKKKKYIYHYQVMEDVTRYNDITKYENRNCLGGCYGKDNLLYITLTRTNAILVWHMDTCKYEIIHIGSAENTYGAIAEVKDGFLLRMYEGEKLLFWNPQSGETREINQFPKDFEWRLNPKGESHPFGGFLITQDHLLLPPQLGNQILEINRDTLEITIYEMNWKEHIKESQEGIYNNQWSHFRNVFIPDRISAINRDFKEVFFVTSADGYMLNLNLDTHQYTEVQTGFVLEDLKKLFPIEELYEKFEIPIKSKEDRYHSLNNFIDAMVEGRISKYNDQQLKVYSQYAANLDGTCGEKVHKAVKKSLQ